MDAHLFFQANAFDPFVAGPDRAIGVGQELRHDEERDAAHAGRRAFDAGQDQVDDVLGQVVFAAADPDLLAGDAVGPIRLGNRLAAQKTEVRATLRLGQVHRAAPFGARQTGQVEGLLLVRPALGDGRIGPVRQAGVHGKRHVGRRRHLGIGQAEHTRQALAAEGRIGAQRWPAGLDHGVVGRLETGGRLDRIVRRPDAAFLVAGAVDRGEHLFAELSALGQDLLDHVHRCVGEAGQVGVVFEAQDLPQHEQLVADRRLIGHGDVTLNDGAGVLRNRVYFAVMACSPSTRGRVTGLATLVSSKSSGAAWAR